MQSEDKSFVLSFCDVNESLFHNVEDRRRLLGDYWKNKTIGKLTREKIAEKKVVLRARIDDKGMEIMMSSSVFEQNKRKLLVLKERPQIGGGMLVIVCKSEKQLNRNYVKFCSLSDGEHVIFD